MKTALVAVALAAFVLPAHAVAVTFCVGTDAACTGVAKGDDLAGAFDDAATMPGADRIQIAAGTYKLPDGGVSYASADGVDVIGAGRGKTTVLAPGGTTLSLGGLGGAASRVRDLTIVAPPGGYAIQTPGRVQDVEVIRIAVGPIGGVLLQGAGSFVGGSIEVGEGWSIVTTGDANRVADAELRSAGGVLATGGSVLVERVSIPRCLIGLMAEGGKLVARDVLVVVVVGIRAALLSRSTSAGDALVDAGQVTLVGPATAPAVRIESPHNGRKSEARVRNAIIVGFSTVLENPGTNIGLVDGGVAWFLDTDPRFVDPGSGNYRLKPDSPAIDKGEPGGLEPGESPTDLDGNPRIAGGRRDLGAYEYQPPVQPPPPADSTPPVVSIAPAIVRLGKTNVLVLRVACPAGESSCAGTLTLRTRRALDVERILARKRRVTLGSARFTLAGGASQVLRVTLSRRNAALIRRLRSVAVVAEAKARDLQGNNGVARRTITVRA